MTRYLSILCLFILGCGAPISPASVTPGDGTNLVELSGLPSTYNHITIDNEGRITDDADPCYSAKLCFASIVGISNGTLTIVYGNVSASSIPGMHGASGKLIYSYSLGTNSSGAKTLTLVEYGSTIQTIFKAQ